MSYPSRKRAALAVAGLVAALLLTACTDVLHDGSVADPGTPLALEVTLAGAAGVTGVEEAYDHADAVRVTLTGETGVALDTVLPFSPGPSETEVFVEVDLEEETELFGLSVELTADGFALFRGEESVELRQGAEESAAVTLEPVVGAPSPAVDVAAGTKFTCAANENGQGFCWGRNDFGQLGDGTTEAGTAPVPLPLWPRFVEVTAGHDHACGLTPNGEAYCWGWNVQGQAGDGTTTDRLLPVKVAGEHVFSAIDAGSYHVCGLEGETALCWGGNGRTQVDDVGGPLGFEPPEVCPVADNSYFGDVLCSTVPRPVAGGLRFSQVSGGTFHSCGTTPGGEGYCWGWNQLLQIGVGPDTTWAFPTPQRVDLGASLASVRAGPVFSCGREPSGAVHCWGNMILDGSGNPGAVWDWGQMGDAAFDGNASPGPVVGGHAFSVVELPSANSIRAGFACGLTAGGTAYCWGINDRGQLGAPGGETCELSTTFDCRSTPAPVSDGHAFRALSLGEDHACGVATDGTLYCWGGNDFGQLGDGTTGDRHRPTAVTSPSTG